MKELTARELARAKFQFNWKRRQRKIKIAKDVLGFTFSFIVMMWMIYNGLFIGGW